MTDTSAAVGLIYHRDPRPEWVARLRGITGENPALPSLVWHWEPGDVFHVGGKTIDASIQRWFVYATWPDSMIRGDYLRQLQGPNPRSTGAYNPRLGRWAGSEANLITRSQWEIYRKHGCYAEPFWVMQGPNGGHKFAFTKWESRLAKLYGGSGTAPLAGSLPYAEPDERTWAALGKADRMRESGQTWDYLSKHPDEFTPEERKAAEYVAKEILDWTGVQFAEHADELAWALRRESLIPRPKAGEVVEEMDEDVVMHDLTTDLVRDMSNSSYQT